MGRLLVHNKIVLFFGCPNSHLCVSYYEHAGLTPVKFSANSTHYLFETQEGATVAGLSQTAMWNEDLFVVEVFKDANSNTIFFFTV